MKTDERIEIFCQAYISEAKFNGTHAARLAGFKPENAHVRASQFLRNSKVQARIKELVAQRNVRMQVRQDQVVRELQRLALSDLSDQDQGWRFDAL
jgi:phage terminase small subunit